MAYDDGRHGLAQRYLIQALRLAQASGNAALGAHVLAGMTDQANLLGHPGEALTLARAGQRGISTISPPACLARLQILEARAHGSLRDATAATAGGKSRTYLRHCRSGQRTRMGAFHRPCLPSRRSRALLPRSS